MYAYCYNTWLNQSTITITAKALRGIGNFWSGIFVESSLIDLISHTKSRGKTALEFYVYPSTKL